MHHFSLRRSLHLAAPVLALGVFGFAAGGCTTTVASSPEGTTTSYVQESGVLVYAPRAARAQKVVFDTGAEQLIHAPDTPLRRFFDAHSKDFADGQLERAKTTILEDIVARLRNREFVKPMIAEVVRGHVDRAINPDLTKETDTGAIVPVSSDKERMKRLERDRQVAADQLVDALYLALVEAGYPDLDEVDLDDLVNEFDKACPTVKPTNRTQERQVLWCRAMNTGRSEEVLQLKQELLHAIRDRRYFRHIIHEASEKRASLFARGMGADTPVGQAKKTLESFLKDDVRELAVDVAKGVRSTWTAFIESERAANRLRAASAAIDDLLVELRADVAARLARGEDPKEAMVAALTARPGLVAPIMTGPAGTPEAALQEVFTRFKTRAAANPRVKTEFERVRVAAEAVRVATETLATTERSVVTSREALAATGRSVDFAKQSRDLVLTAERVRVEYASATDAKANQDVIGLRDLATVAEVITRSTFGSAAAVTSDVLLARSTSGPLEVIEGAAERLRGTARADEVKGAYEALAAKLGSTPGVPDRLAKALQALITDTKAMEDRLRVKDQQDAFAKLMIDVAAVRNAEKEVEPARAAIPTKQRDLEARVGSADSQDTLFAALRHVFSVENEGFGESQRQDLQKLLPAVRSRFGDAFEPFMNGREQLTTGKLEELLEYALRVELRLLTDPVAKAIASRFKATFGRFPELVTSEEPVLKAVLASGRITFSSPAARGIARDRLPALVLEPWTKTEGSPAATPDALVKQLETALARAEVGFLFGDSSAGAIQAFRDELYQAFRHRLPEILATERDTGYEYWWLTFYPKAVPLGDRRIEGESVIELGFPERSIPQEEYARWLADGDASTHSRKTGDYLGGPANEVIGHDDRVLRASEMLTGFIEVFRASEQVQRPEVLSAIVAALSCLSQQGETYEQMLQHLDSSMPGESVARCPGTLPLVAAPIAPVEQLVKGVTEASLDVVKAYGTELDEALTKVKSEARSPQPDYAAAREQALLLPFNLHHTKLALRAVAEGHAAVFPTKLDLFLNAFFDGVERFRHSRLLSQESGVGSPIFDEETLLRYMAAHWVAGDHQRTPWKKLEGIVTEWLRRRLPGLPGAQRWAQIAVVDSLELRLRRTAAMRFDARRALIHALSKTPLGDVWPGLTLPEAWTWELRHDIARANLRAAIGQAFHSAYPEVPLPENIHRMFLSDERNLDALVYLSIRDLYRNYRTDLDAASSQVEFDLIERSLKGRVRRWLAAQPYLSPDVARKIQQALPSVKPDVQSWMTELLTNERAMLDYRRGALQHLYGGLWTALGRLSESERRPLERRGLTQAQYNRFLLWGRPVHQPGLQIIDLLPASRDDLVAMSVNEGGVIARAAAQGDGAVAYDVNEVRMAQRNARLLREKARKEGKRPSVDGGPASVVNAIDGEGSARAADFLETLESLGQGSESMGTSLGGSARGSIYGRARAALAYARRREYLDAAITAAGRGDNFAKWVVRPSDVRTALAGTDGSKLVAAAHNGHPNGDQPFHVLLKVPNDAVHTDWAGRRYILFNSSYAATCRVPLQADGGWLGWIIKAVSWLLHPPLLEAEEARMVGTVYPFQWDVTSDEEQRRLLQHGNALGGRIQLDDTDRIKYSEVRKLLDAEAGFIRVTRMAQSGDLGRVMDELSKESEAEHDDVREDLERRREQERARFEALGEADDPEEGAAEEK